MARMVIVIDFEEPKDDMVMAGMIYRAQEAFKGVDGVKLHMARNGVADTIIHIFDPIHEGEEESGAPDEPKEGG